MTRTITAADRAQPSRDVALALIVLAILVVTALLTASSGFSWDGLRLPLRVTARMSVFLFAIAFALPGIPRARAWHPTAALAFAACHFIHLGLILARAGVGHRPELLGDVGGVLTYALIAFIAWRAYRDRAGSDSSRLERLAGTACWWLVLAFFVFITVSDALEHLSWPVLSQLKLAALLMAAVVRVVGQRFSRTVSPA